MRNDSPGGGRALRSPLCSRPAVELLLVAGISAFLIFVVIPAETTPGDEIGLSPDLLPTAAAAAIGLLAVLQFVMALLRPRPDDVDAPPVRHVLPLIAAAVAGVLVIGFIGWEAGGALLSLLVLLVLGERGIVRLAAVPAVVAAVLFMIGKLGI
jgi:hypothetical protein